MAIGPGARAGSETHETLQAHYGVASTTALDQGECGEDTSN